LFAHSPQEITCKLDITDLVVNVMEIGKRNLIKILRVNTTKKRVGKYTMLLLTKKVIATYYHGQFRGFQWQMIHVN
jgi:hypothetical protein